MASTSDNPGTTSSDALPSTSDNKMVVLSNAKTRHSECGLCLEEMTSPRIFPCFHTFCLPCIKKLTENLSSMQLFPCPSCRSMVQIPASGVESFQVNFYVEAELERSCKAKRSCQGCDVCNGAYASNKCLDCDQFLCVSCTRFHSAFASTRSHSVLDLSELDLAQDISARVASYKRDKYCSIHTDEKLRFFCAVCCKSICRDCKLTSHDGHRCSDIASKCAAAKQLIVNVTEKSRQSLEPKLKQTIEAIKIHKARLLTKKADLKRIFHKRADDIKKEVDVCLARTEQQLDCDAESIFRVMQKMQDKYVTFLTICEDAEGILRSENVQMMMNFCKELRDFFGVKRIEPATAAGFPISCSDKAGLFGKGSKSQQMLELCELQEFALDNWREDIQLSLMQPQEAAFHTATASSTPSTAVQTSASSTAPTSSGSFSFVATDSLPSSAPTTTASSTAPTPVGFQRRSPASQACGTSKQNAPPSSRGFVFEAPQVVISNVPSPNVVLTGPTTAASSTSSSTSGGIVLGPPVSLAGSSGGFKFGVVQASPSNAASATGFRFASLLPSNTNCNFQTTCSTSKHTPSTGTSTSASGFCFRLDNNTNNSTPSSSASNSESSCQIVGSNLMMPSTSTSSNTNTMPSSSASNSLSGHQMASNSNMVPSSSASNSESGRQMAGNTNMMPSSSGLGSGRRMAGNTETMLYRSTSDLEPGYRAIRRGKRKPNRKQGPGHILAALVAARSGLPEGVPGDAGFLQRTAACSISKEVTSVAISRGLQAQIYQNLGRVRRVRVDDEIPVTYRWVSQQQRVDDLKAQIVQDLTSIHRFFADLCNPD